MTAIIVINYRDRISRSNKTDTWKATEIFPAYHQKNVGLRVLVQRNDYTNVYDVSHVKGYSLLQWLADYAKVYYENDITDITIVSLEAY